MPSCHGIQCSRSGSIMGAIVPSTSTASMYPVIMSSLEWWCFSTLLLHGLIWALTKGPYNQFGHTNISTGMYSHTYLWISSLAPGTYVHGACSPHLVLTKYQATCLEWKLNSAHIKQHSIAVSFQCGVADKLPFCSLTGQYSMVNWAKFTSEWESGWFASKV